MQPSEPKKLGFRARIKKMWRSDPSQEDSPSDEEQSEDNSESNAEDIDEMALQENALDVNRSFSKICRAKSYPFERHKVLTKDGYWLTVFRIMGSKGQSTWEALAQRKPALYLQHGVVDSADTFIMNDEKRAPGFMFANAGYDVWLGNTRGNKYSKEHTYLDPTDDEDKKVFFDFSFGEMAEYDVPAIIEHIRVETSKDKIAVVAHSQGATLMLVKMSNDIHWWNERVAIFGCLGGVAKLDYTSSKLIKDLANQKYVLSTMKGLGVVEIFPSNYLQSKVFSSVSKRVPFISDFLIELVADADTSTNNQSRVGVFMNHYPSGSSLKSFEHFAQIIISGRFQNYDYGHEINMQIYGHEIPPIFDLSKIKDAKTIMIVGEYDLLSSEKDNEWLQDELGDNVIFYNTYPLGHTSFLISEDMTYIKDTIEVLKNNAWK